MKFHMTKINNMDNGKINFKKSKSECGTADQRQLVGAYIINPKEFIQAVNKHGDKDFCQHCLIAAIDKYKFNKMF